MARAKKKTATVDKPLTVYQRGPDAAVIGPLHSYEVGDVVTIPARGSKLGDEGLPGFTGEVYQVAQDGAAMVRSPRAA